MVIDKDWLVCQHGLALSRPLHWCNRAILKYPKFKEMDLWNDSLMSSKIWNCPFSSLSQVLEDTWRNLGGVKLFFFESKICFKKKKSTHKESFEDISAFTYEDIGYGRWRRRCEGWRQGFTGGPDSDRWQSARCKREEEKKTGGEKKMRWDWKTFSCWDLNC